MDEKLKQIEAALLVLFLSAALVHRSLKIETKNLQREIQTTFSTIVDEMFKRI